MFLNSSSNHFNISSFPQYNNPTLIPLVKNYLLFPILFPWSTWNTGTASPGDIQDTWSMFSKYLHQLQITLIHYTNPTLISLVKNYLLFPTLFPRSIWITGTISLETYQTYGQYSQNNSMDDRSLQNHMETFSE